MNTIQSVTKSENYETEIRSASGHFLLSDEPEVLGGKNHGMSPDELLISALASCTSATLKMYAQRKGWDLQEVRTEIQLTREKPSSLPVIRRKIELIGDLDEKQRERMMDIANKCPVHKVLSLGVEIISHF